MVEGGYVFQQDTIYFLLRTAAQSHPQSPALLGLDRQPLSYNRLLGLVENTAQTLAALHIGRGDRVAMVLPNGPEAAACFLSVAATATSAPLNSAYSRSEFEFYFYDLKPKALIADARSDSPAIGVAQSMGMLVLRLQPVANRPAGIFELVGHTVKKPANEPRNLAEPEEIALVLHTSGSTSRPKMVSLTNANLCISARNIQASLGLSDRDRCLNIMPLYHIHGLIGAVLSSLSIGASVVCTPGLHALQFFEWLAEFEPTWYTGVPTMHQAILRVALQRPDIDATSGLRFIRSCSSPLAPRLMADMESAFGIPMLEAYGMTEASHQIATNRLPPGIRKPGSVGLPEGCAVAIMDEQGSMLTAGKVGHVAIRGTT